MINIMCYGDSNTYGYNPRTGRRYDTDTRWTRILQKKLGSDFYVIEEGCNGRTTNFNTEEEPWKNGWVSLKTILNTHKPLDLVILMLGTNDMKDCFEASAEAIAENIHKYVLEITAFTGLKQDYPAKVLLMAPPLLGEKIENGIFGRSFGPGSHAKSEKLSGLYEKVAKETGCLFLDTSKYIKASGADMLHLDPEAHKILGEMIAELIAAEFSS